MAAKTPDFVISEHVFHAGSEAECTEFVKRHKQDIIQIDRGPDRVVVTIAMEYPGDSAVFATATYPK
jgi:hypothetical protein